MLTNDEKKMLRVVAVYNDITEDQAKAAILKDYLAFLAEGSRPICNLKLEHIEEPKAAWKPLPEKDPKPAPLPDFEKPRKKPGPKPKKQTVNEIAEEIEQTETNAKMTKDEFIEYMSRRQEREHL